MKDIITFKIVTPYGVIYEDEIEKATIPTSTGEITVMPRHAPLVSRLKAGEVVVYKKDAVPHRLAISTGILEIGPDSVLYLLADTAERAEDIDIARAEEAKRRAEELLKQEHEMADIDFARLQAQIEREFARISVGKKYKNISR